MQVRAPDYRSPELVTPVLRPRGGEVSLSKQNIAFVQPLEPLSESPIGLAHELPTPPAPLSSRRRRPRKATPTFISPFCLDGFQLIQCAGVQDPQEALEASVCGRGFTSVLKDDLCYFTSLSAVDADENRLPFNSLDSLPLVELRMRCNNLEHLQFDAPGFNQLRVLDVSFNKIHPDSIIHLAKAPNLVQLSLASNQLTWLPECLEQMAQLRVLDLESNFINTRSSIARLAVIPRLQTLNLSANGLQKWYPVPVGGFCSLRQISISRNAIEDVDDVLCGLSRRQIPLLRHLRCWGNPFCDGLSLQEHKWLTLELAAGTEIEMELEIRDPVDAQPMTVGSQLAALSRRTSKSWSKPSTAASTAPAQGRLRQPQLPRRAWQHGSTLGFTAKSPNSSYPDSASPTSEPRSSCCREPQRIFAQLRASLVGTSSSSSGFGSKKFGYLRGTRKCGRPPKLAPSYGGNFPSVACTDTMRGYLQHDNGRQRLVEKKYQKK